MLVDKNEVFWAWGTAGSRRYNLFKVRFGLKMPLLKKDRENILMGGKSGKKNIGISKKNSYVEGVPRDQENHIGSGESLFC